MGIETAPTIQTPTNQALNHNKVSSDIYLPSRTIGDVIWSHEDSDSIKSSVAFTSKNLS
jgi:hypothetical protein